MTKPCVNCGLGVEADIWEEELGFCVECSHKYWNHELDGE